MKDSILFDRFDLAGKVLKDCRVNDTGAEKNYGKAYQRLVMAGLMLQIKKKYRGGK